MFLSSLGTKVIKKDLNKENLSLKNEHYWQPYLTAQAPSAHWAEGCTEFLSQESFEFPQVNSECAPCKWDWALGPLWHLLSREQEAAQLDYCSLLPWFQFSSHVLGRPGWSIVSAFSGQHLSCGAATAVVIVCVWCWAQTPCGRWWWFALHSNCLAGEDSCEKVLLSHTLLALCRKGFSQKCGV